MNGAIHNRQAAPSAVPMRSTNANSGLDELDDVHNWDWTKMTWEMNGKYPTWLCQQFANWKMTIEIVDWPTDSMVIFDSYVNVYQRVMGIYGIYRMVPPSDVNVGL